MKNLAICVVFENAGLKFPVLAVCLVSEDWKRTTAVIQMVLRLPGASHRGLR